ESALADAGAAEAAAAAETTDALAAALVGGTAPPPGALREKAERLRGAGEIAVVAPEGFSYYALRPGDIADRFADPPLDRVREAAVVGLRSIGTTLSAVACASVRARGGPAERRTVRPTGPPYDRVTLFTERDVAWIRRGAALGREFVVVDEGPGMSGSSI